ncbi:DUF3558 family protein [Amycolatopsis alba]|uniref:DUF3558 domain-containing protein n=1 Tax=Amycolatopsis alba DSM 44262 TaxID=1125972 RepID=A0A229S0H8_AMYAL|nr:DUF3558 family protein [Amycolatopsis alba]OXM52410.1 DUF3558 domain-containing protein [Amycolatopsis alba DSM 44262]
MKKLYVVPLAAAALVLAACSSEKPGNASPAPSAPPAQTGGSSSAPATGAGDTKSIDPCSLLGVADLTSYGTFKPPTTANEGGARSCQFDKAATSAADAVSLGVDIRDTQNVDSVGDAGNGKTTGNVNGRKAVLAPKPGGCLMALELGPSARVDVLVAAAETKQACEIAEKIADIVEPKLPKS